MKTTTNHSGINQHRAYLIAGALALFAVGALFYQQDGTSSAVSETGKIAQSSSASFSISQDLRFIENRGQAGSDAKYHVQGAGHTVLFYEDKVLLRRDESGTAKNEIALQFKGANKSPAIVGVEKLPGVAHFYEGQNPDKWNTNVPTYKSVKYTELYPGIDMAYIGDNGKLESEFYVSPGIDYHQIRLNYQGVKSKTIRDDGALVIETELGDLIEESPFAYQEVNGDRKEITAQYVLLADASVGFELSNYDNNYPLVIDPAVVFITAVPGSVDGGEWATAITTDSSGNLIIVGAANNFFPVNDTIAGSNHTSSTNHAGLLIKLDGTTGAVIFSALFGGTDFDSFDDVAIDPAGNLYLTGNTISTDFPVLNAAQDTLAGSQDAFLVIFDAAGILTYSSYLGGSQSDNGTGIAVDGSGNIYVGGTTQSGDFPVTGGLQSTLLGFNDTYFTKFSSAGSIVYSTYLGGTGGEQFKGLVVDSSGQVTIAGITSSTDFPLMNAFQNTLSGINDIYVTRMNSSGSGIIYSSLFGGADREFAGGIALGLDGAVYIVGNTRSLDFPIVNGLSTPEAGVADGILIGLDNSGQPIYSLRTNIPGPDRFFSVAVNDSNTAFAASNYRDTLRIYQKMVDSSMVMIFETVAPGHQFQDSHLANGLMAFASTFFPPSPVNSDPGYSANSLSLSQVGGAVVKLEDDFEIDCSGVQFFIKMLKPGNLKVDADADGKLTINGESTIWNASGTAEIIVIGSAGNDLIDLSGVTADKFPQINFDINIFGGDGNDILIGSPDYRNNMNGGAGEDRLTGGSEGDIMGGGGGVDFLDGGPGQDRIFWSPEDDIMFGGVGADRYIFEDNFVDLPLLRPYSKTTSLNVVSIVDSSGVDTLDFSASVSGITLDVALQDSAQTIDTAGTRINLQGIFEVVIGSDFDDEITVSPLQDSTRHIDGGAGVDILNVVYVGVQSTDDGSTISTPGFADITYTNIETVNLLAALGCCVGITGNIDCDPGSVVDITDLTVLIDHLFLSLSPLCCKPSGNVDGDTQGIVDITDLTFLIDHLFISLVPTAACQ